MALKAQWLVTAEIIPGQRFEELTKCWQYNSKDYEMDTIQEGAPIFTRYKQEATAYALSLQDPTSVNIVTLQFMWF